MANITLVEPFMYESMVLKKLCTPEAFRRAGLIAQPVSKYLNVSHFMDTRHFIPYDDFFRTAASPVANDDGAIVVTAAVHFIWDNADDLGIPFPNAQNQSEPTLFFPCDDAFRKVPYNQTSNGWLIEHGLYARHAVCMDGRGDWMRPTTLPQFLSHLFRTVRALPGGEHISNSERRNPARNENESSKPVSVVMINYRKYITERFQPTQQKLPQLAPAPPSAFGIQIATRLISQHFQDEPFVAIQFRTGRTMATLRHNAFLNRGREDEFSIEARATLNRLFRGWVFECADTLIDNALIQAARLSTAFKNPDGMQNKTAMSNVAFYLASDIFNDGWKNGEYETSDTRLILNDVDTHFQNRLGRVIRFNPSAHTEITQDFMGLSAVADISVAYLSPAFVSHILSTVGRHVADVRSEWRDAKSVMCECPEPNLDSDLLTQ